MKPLQALAHMLEPEEFIGSHWHALVGAAASWPRFADAAVTFDRMRAELGVFFRGLGGPASLKLAASVAESSRHRLSLRLRLGLGEERLSRPQRDHEALYLPPAIDVFPETALNRDLYLWLAAFFVFAQPPVPAADPLHRDIAFLAAANAATRAVLAAFPGLAPLHAGLCGGLRSLRPARRLPAAEHAVEAAVLHLLGQPGDGGPFWPAVIAEPAGQAELPAAPRRYRPFLPVPLWGEIVAGDCQAAAPADADKGGGGYDADDGRVRKASRRPADQTERNDGLILNRMEKLLSLIEHMNINRAVEDDDDEGARKALDDAEAVVVSPHRKKAATKLKFDLDLSSGSVTGSALAGEHTYPEWDFAARQYRRDHCRIIAGPALETGELWEPDAATWRRIHRVRRQFEALRPRPEILRAQVDGPELDLDAVVRARADLRSSGAGSDRVHLSTRRQARDLAVALLVDTSLSTDAWINNRRVLDIAKEALLILAHGLAACGDDHAIWTFTSRRRDRVEVGTVKDFDERFSAAVQRRIAALRPGHYTRMGAAVRHAAAELARRPHRHRLLLVVTDGKPNDVDHYEGRYGVEDTARAVREARRGGLAVFGVTIDRKAQAYFPTLFGRGGYAILSDAARLPLALPALYRHLVAN